MSDDAVVPGCGDVEVAQVDRDGVGACQVDGEAGKGWPANADKSSMAPNE